jgi:hypothetical protein
MIKRRGERIIKPHVDTIKSNPLLSMGTFSGSKGIQAKYPKYFE